MPLLLILESHISYLGVGGNTQTILVYPVFMSRPTTECTEPATIIPDWKIADCGDSWQQLRIKILIESARWIPRFLREIALDQETDERKISMFPCQNRIPSQFKLIRRLGRIFKEPSSDSCLATISLVSCAHGLFQPACALCSVAI